ncbi:short-chain dehydrogenase/reductase SDR [Actinomycetes bacterium KLBMP 9797]
MLGRSAAGWTGGAGATQQVEQVDPFRLIEPQRSRGFFRTELLVEGFSTIWPELSIDDYAPRTATTVEFWQSMNGQQPGDPAKLARALLAIADQEKPLPRFVASADAIEAAQAKASELLAQADASRELDGNLTYDYTHA